MALWFRTPKPEPVPESLEDVHRRLVREEISRSLGRIESDISRIVPAYQTAHVHRIAHQVLRSCLTRECDRLDEETKTKIEERTLPDA